MSGIKHKLESVTDGLNTQNITNVGAVSDYGDKDGQCLTVVNFTSLEIAPIPNFCGIPCFWKRGLLIDAQSLNYLGAWAGFPKPICSVGDLWKHSLTASRETVWVREEWSSVQPNLDNQCGTKTSRICCQVVCFCTFKHGTILGRSFHVTVNSDRWVQQSLRHLYIEALWKDIQLCKMASVDFKTLFKVRV